MRPSVSRSTAYRTISIIALFTLVAAFTWLPTTEYQSLDESLYSQPLLLRKAAEAGLWPGMVARTPEDSDWSFYVKFQTTYAISDKINPFYQHGDFDHDGICDLAIAVIERNTGRFGFAMIPGTLDTVHLFNVGPAMIPEHYLEIRGWDVEYIIGPYVRRIDRDRLILYRKSGPATAFEVIDGVKMTYVEDNSEGDIPDPPLVIEARKEGLWPEGIRYEIIRQRDHNPSYMRGDFNGDGEFDIAVLVRDTSNREPGIVIIHSTLDSLHTLFPSTLPEGTFGITNPGRITLIPKGEILRPWPLPEPKPPIELKADAILATVWPGSPYAGAWYFKGGRYQWVTLSD